MNIVARRKPTSNLIKCRSNGKKRNNENKKKRKKVNNTNDELKVILRKNFLSSFRPSADIIYGEFDT